MLHESLTLSRAQYDSALEFWVSAFLKTCVILAVAPIPIGVCVFEGDPDAIRPLLLWYVGLLVSNTTLEWVALGGLLYLAYEGVKRFVRRRRDR